MGEREMGAGVCVRGNYTTINILSVNEENVCKMNLNWFQYGQRVLPSYLSSALDHCGYDGGISFSFMFQTSFTPTY